MSFQVGDCVIGLKFAQNGFYGQIVAVQGTSKRHNYIVEWLNSTQSNMGSDSIKKIPLEAYQFALKTRDAQFQEPDSSDSDSTSSSDDESTDEEHEGHPSAEVPASVAA